MKMTPTHFGNNTIWVDLDNSPHVPFFTPIVAKFREKRIEVKITVRDCFQVCGLADRNKLEYKKIGQHYGKNLFLKSVGTLLRAVQLLPYAAHVQPAVAVSHGSRAMNIAARILNIRTVEMTDYEFACDVPFLHPDLLIVPEIIKFDQNRKNGKTRIATYPGIKEDVYVPFFQPNESIRKELRLSGEKVIVTIRPPATEAHYHNSESEILFEEVINTLGRCDNIKMVVLPRNAIAQTELIKCKWADLIVNGKLVIPEKVIDGLNLIWHSDFVISGGGTMNREAAALGVPVYSIFRGKTGAVDRYLCEHQRLTLIKSKADVHNLIRVGKRKVSDRESHCESDALNSIVNAICSLM